MAAFKILTYCLFDEQSVVVERTKNRMKLPAWLAKQIDLEWEIVCKEKQARGLREPRNEAQSRLEAYSIKDGTLYLTLGETDYKEQIGTHPVARTIADELGEDYLSNQLGASSVIETADKRLLFYERSQQVVAYPGWINTCGGHLGLTKNIFESMRAEIKEETGIEASDIESIACTGLVRDMRTMDPEIVFSTKVKMDSKDLKGVAETEGAFEHDKMLFIENNPKDVMEFVVKYDERFVPPGQGAAVAHGRLYFGKAWEEEALRELHKRRIERAYRSFL